MGKKKGMVIYLGYKIERIIDLNRVMIYFIIFKLIIVIFEFWV